MSLRSACTLILFAISSASLFSQEWLVAVPQRAIFSIAANPVNSRSMIAGNYARGFIASADGGETWLELAVGELGGSSQITALLYNPGDTNILLAGGIGFNGIDRSTDGGFTWSNVLSDPLGSRYEFASSGSFAFMPGNPDVVFAARGVPPVIYQSGDKGETWDSLSAITGVDESARLRAIAVCPTRDSSHIMLATGRRIAMHRSTDGGKTWVNTKYTLGTAVMADGSQIRWSPTVPGRVYATSSISAVGNGGLHVSDDYGITWKLMKFSDTSFNAIEVYSHKSGDEIFLGGGEPHPSGSLVKGDSIIFRSPDGGNTWQELSKVPWTENELGDVFATVWGFAVTQGEGPAEVFMATEVGVYRSTYVTDVHEQLLNSSITIRSAASSFTIANPHNETTSVIVLNMLGSEVMRLELPPAPQNRVALEQLPAGAYVVRAISASGSGSSLILR